MLSSMKIILSYIVLPKKIECAADVRKDNIPSLESRSVLVN